MVPTDSSRNHRPNQRLTRIAARADALCRGRGVACPTLDDWLQAEREVDVSLHLPGEGLVPGRTASPAASPEGLDR